jgi:hypothetical protein
MKELIAFAVAVLLTISTGALAFMGAASPAAACGIDVCQGTGDT